MAFKTVVVMLLPLPLPPPRLAWEFQCVEWKKFASVQWCTHHESECCFFSLFYDFMIVRMRLTEISNFKMTCSPTLMVMVVKNCVPYATNIFHVSERLMHRTVIVEKCGNLERMRSNPLRIVRFSSTFKDLILYTMTILCAIQRKSRKSMSIVPFAVPEFWRFRSTFSQLFKIS